MSSGPFFRRDTTATWLTSKVSELQQRTLDLSEPKAEVFRREEAGEKAALAGTTAVLLR
jgi:hypothetical protein